MPETIGKVRALATYRDKRQLPLKIVVDGAVSVQTAPALRQAGADVFVGGSSGLFRPGDVGSHARALIAAIAKAEPRRSVQKAR